MKGVIVGASVEGLDDISRVFATGNVSRLPSLDTDSLKQVLKEAVRLNRNEVEAEVRRILHARGVSQTLIARHYGRPA